MRQLEVFVAVARAGSFRRAAERLHLSQPALSQHVAELERGLGARVFDRRGRQIALTEAGRILEDHAHRVFATLHGAEEAIAELAGGTRGALVIGASTTPGIYVLPALMSRFERGQPGISVALRIANSRVIEEQVRANELDLGVVGGHGLRPGEACLAAGVLDELVLIVPPGHAWARRARGEVSVLARERLLIREEGSATRQVTERALQRADARIGRTLVLDHTEAIKQAVMAGLGVAFVSIHAVRGELEAGRLVRVRLRGVDIHRHFHVIHNEARVLTAGARAFVAALEAYGKQVRARNRR
ncbi:MAG TPA: LysR substrate-binding domain-containing protein [Methylomirabilota bacterium]